MSTTNTTAESKERPNFIKIKDGMYIVRTQAGFSQAVKEYHDDADSEARVNNWPKSYPAFVSLSTGYDGGLYVWVNQIHINDLLAAIKDQ